MQIHGVLCRPRCGRWALVCFLWAASLTAAESGETPEQQARRHFDRSVLGPWRTVVHDPCTGDWHSHWTLDGEKATVTTDTSGMAFTAGPVFRDDAHHAVMWSRRSFRGDVKIDYEYTRLDTAIRCVTILYVQATGSGEDGFPADIAAAASSGTESPQG